MRSLDLFKIGTVFLKLISNSFPPSPSPVLSFLAVLIFFFFRQSAISNSSSGNYWLRSNYLRLVNYYVHETLNEMNETKTHLITPLFVTK